MSECCGGTNAKPATSCCGQEPLAWFEQMIPHCLDYAQQEQAAGRPIVGIMCEYTPRELIMAAGGVPVCLCGGSAKMIEPAEQDLPTGLCPLIKSTYGYHKQRTNPFLEMADLVVAETTCDGKKKMFELMADTRPLHVLELTQKQDDADGREHWYREIVKLKEALEERFRTEITPCKLRQAIQSMNTERRLRRELAQLMTADCPPLTGLQLLQLKSSISCIPADLAQYEAAIARYAKDEGDAELGSRIRVLLTGVPLPHGAERVAELIEDHGGLIVCQENCTGVKPVLEDVDADAADPLRAIADKYFHLPCSVMTPNPRRTSSLYQLASLYRPQCIIELVWSGCLTYAVEGYRIKRLAEYELKIPYLRIETDYSTADSARIVNRIEALFETIADRVVASV